MFCPLCKAEYREGFSRCADCDVDLVPALEDEIAAEPEEPIVVLWQGEDPVVFSAITSALRGAEIFFQEALGQDHRAYLSDPFPVRLLHSRLFEVRVFEKDAAAAGDIVREVLEGVPPEEAQP